MLPPQMSEEQALVYVETIKTMLESVEKEEDDEIREILLQRKLEEAEREDALRNLLRRGNFGFVKRNAGVGSQYYFYLSAPQDREDNLYRQLRGGRFYIVGTLQLHVSLLHSRCLVNMR